MIRSSSSKLLAFHPEINRTTRRRLKSAARAVENPVFEKQQVGEEELQLSEGENSVVAMADQRRMMVEYARPTLDSTGSCIVRPTIEANNFEVKASTMNMIHNQCQFNGLPDKDPHAHIQMFIDICVTVKQNGEFDEALKLQLFPFTLRGKAKQWFSSMD